MTIYQILLADKVIIPIYIRTHDRVYWIWMELDELLDFGKFKIQDATSLPCIICRYPDGLDNCFS